MNKKGFAISIILYSIVFVLITTFYILLGILKTRYTVNDNMRNDLMDELNNFNAAVTLKRKIAASSCNPSWVDNMDTPDDKIDDIIYLSGHRDCVTFNYVWYSGRLWRVVAIYPDDTIKLITDNSMTVLSWGISTDYPHSFIYQWLNQDFYNTLVNSNNIIETSRWNYSTDAGVFSVRPETYSVQNITDAKVGLLNVYEYYNTSRNTTYDGDYLKNGFKWHLLTPANSTNIRGVSIGGTIETNSIDYSVSVSNMDNRAVRPSIVLKSNIKFIGSGTISNPFKITIDKEKPEYNTSLLNSRSIGEYVKFDNKIYRILEINNNRETKLILNNYLQDTNNEPILKRIASTNIYGKSSNTKTDNYWDYYLNNTWYNSISDNYKRMLVDGIFYLGSTNANINYKSTICKDSDLDNVLTTSCTKYTSSDVDKMFIGKVGLSRVGEIFESQPPGSKKMAYAIWSLTPVGSTVRLVDVYDNGTNNTTSTFVKATYSVRPIITLKPTVKITSGDGYIGGSTNSPYEISNS